MNQDLKDLVNNSGLKKKYIAEKIGLNPSVLSMCLRGERFLNPDKEKQLKDVLKMVS